MRTSRVAPLRAKHSPTDTRQEHLFLSDRPTALQAWRLGPACRYGVPTLWGCVRAVGWPGPDHCWFCQASLDAICAEYERQQCQEGGPR